MRWNIPSHVAWQLVDERAVMVDLNRGRSVGLNASATVIWRMLPDKSIDEIVSTLEKEFNVDAATARRDIDDLIAELESRELLVRR